MKRRFFAFLLIFALAFSITGSAFAQTYFFQLEKETVHVYYNDDGSMSVDYVFVFLNDSSASPIDFVDVGMPNNNFRNSSIKADVDGVPVKISSDYQGDGGSGFAVELGSQAIQPGTRGTVHVYVGYIDEVLYTDDDDETYASAVFGTTWFGSQYVYGYTDLSLSIHLPTGVQTQEPRYHLPEGWSGEAAPTSYVDGNGRVTYTWQDSQANGHTQYTFGASFPKSYVPESAIVTPSIFDGIDFEVLFFICFFGFFFIVSPILSVFQSRKRKMKYMPPKIAIEGHGIKRGLTAVESAILMELPLDKVMTMVLFGVIKKGAAQVTNRDPLKIQVTEPQPENLRPYEKDFLKAFDDGTKNRTAQRKDLQKVTVELVRSVGKKMKGFSRKETIAYYKNIMERAWQQIEDANTPEVKSEKFDQALEWTMLDKDYDERTRDVFRRGPVYTPTWWGRYDPTFGRSAASTTTARPATSSSGKSLTSSMPQLPGADFAASVVGGAQSFSDSVIGNINDFTGGVTKTTNPVPVSTSSGRSSGGGSCACACACAGCACACAGGGR